jgi:hypothetical protein
VRVAAGRGGQASSGAKLTGCDCRGEYRKEKEPGKARLLKAPLEETTGPEGNPYRVVPRRRHRSDREDAVARSIRDDAMIANACVAVLTQRKPSAMDGRRQ